MKRLALLMVAMGVLHSALVAPAVAQKKDISARGYFGVGGGFAVPVGNYGDLAKTGWLANLIGGFTTKGGIFGGRADAMWAQNSLKGESGRERLVGLNVDVVLTPGHRPANWHPYFLAGVGVYNGKDTSPAVTGSDTKLAINAGAGVQLHTGHRTDVFLEGRFLTIRTAGTPLNLVPITLGLRWGGI
jgi:opacity protein-like surface antigen